MCSGKKGRTYIFKKLKGPCIYHRLQKLDQMYISINIHNKDKWHKLIVSEKQRLELHNYISLKAAHWLQNNIKMLKIKM